MIHITHRVGIKAPVIKVYEALSTVQGISGWWTQHTSGTSQIGKSISVHFHSPDGKVLGSMTMKVIELETSKKVHWKFLEGPDEWIGTEVTFELKQEGDYTIVLFAHRNWKEEVEFTSHCSMKWAIFLVSLKELIETGTGKPSPFDYKIDNWN
jgi:uncharacterized protein YndB with AHSA1/START domain